VRRALSNLFPQLEFTLVEGELIGESEAVASLARFHALLRSQQILDTARSVMFSKRRGNFTRLTLNKQAAYVGKISFTDGESPLGPITVELEASDLERLIDYLAPRTKDGKPIFEISYP
jgi:hypothetical protein